MNRNQYPKGSKGMIQCLVNEHKHLLDQRLGAVLRWISPIEKDGFAESQPIWLSAGDDNPNHATLLFLVDGANILPDDAQNFERIFNIFDGNDENALELARSQWKQFKSSGLETYYWQQESSGKWIQKA